jgi:hypothetical protein
MGGGTNIQEESKQEESELKEVGNPILIQRGHVEQE